MQEQTTTAEPTAEPVALPSLPLPPPEFKDVFMPILQGLLVGLEARRNLHTLAIYCIELEMAIEKIDAGSADSNRLTSDDGSAK